MEYKPDIIISVHPMMQHIPLQVLKWQKLHKKVTFVTVITDLNTCHRSWYSNNTVFIFIFVELCSFSCLYSDLNLVFKVSSVCEPTVLPLGGGSEEGLARWTSRISYSRFWLTHSTLFCSGSSLQGGCNNSLAKITIIEYKPSSFIVLEFEHFLFVECRMI